MAYALIDPFCQATRITSWTPTPTNSFFPEREVLEGKHCISQIENATFEVASPFHWVECNASVDCEDYYYDPIDSTIKALNHEPAPVTEQTPA